jgi:transposase-like protein
MGDIALLGGRRRRRSWTTAQKLAIVNEAKRGDDPVSVVARRHGMNANHLFNWMQRERDGTLDRSGLYAQPGGPMDFVDLGVVGSVAAASVRAGVIEIELTNGVRLKVAGAVDLENLRQVLAAVTCLPKPCA